MPDPPRSDHPSLGAILLSARRDFDAALDGDPSVLFRLKLTAQVTLWGVPDANNGAEIQVDFNEGKQPVTFDLTIEPSAITLARLEARAQVVKDELLQAWAQTKGEQEG